jgi:3-oxoacyl-[acyl-carrier protein] reductase
VRDDHVVIVTGAAAGLGRAMTRGLLAAGRRVAAVDLAHETASNDANLLTVTASVRSDADCERAVAETLAHFGRVDALINNAGLGIAWVSPDPATMIVPFYTAPVDRWRALIDTNVNGPFLMARAVTPHLIAAGWGRIVNITTSYATMIRGGNSPYGPAKAALEAATVVWSADLAGTGVTVNVLIPGGASDTAMVTHAEARDRSTLIRPDVMIAPAVWLTSQAADGVTGRRFIGRDWDPAAPIAANVARAGAPAGWRPD